MSIRQWKYKLNYVCIKKDNTSRIFSNKKIQTAVPSKHAYRIHQTLTRQFYVISTKELLDSHTSVDSFYDKRPHHKFRFFTLLVCIPNIGSNAVLINFNTTNTKTCTRRKSGTIWTEMMGFQHENHSDDCYLFFNFHVLFNHFDTICLPVFWIM